MFEALLNVFRIPDLRRKVLFTLLIIVVYRIGAHVPTPGIDGAALAHFFETLARQQGGSLFGIMNLFSGGAMAKATIFALGIMPYVSSSIILQLLTVVIPQLEQMAKEGEEGRKKIIQYTRYGTVVLSLVQSFFIALWLEHPQAFGGYTIVPHPGWMFRIIAVLTMTTGTAFIMWLGEQIDEQGIGNGISIVITAGIIDALPGAFGQLMVLFSPFDAAHRQLDLWKLWILLPIAVFVTVAVVMLIQGQRKIPIQSARRIMGRRVMQAQSTYLPLRVNAAGVIPIIFAQSVVLFPATIAGFVPNAFLKSVAQALSPGHWVYSIIYSLLIVFFAYFYTAITFNPIDIAENLKKWGSFIPGIRPGQATAEHLDYVMTRIILPGSVALAAVALFPNLISHAMKIPFLVASFLGGTGLLIIVGVMLDTIKALESQLLMRHYDGFIKKGRVKGRG
jgi:preprotein translocase subunit SecY